MSDLATGHGEGVEGVEIDGVGDFQDDAEEVSILVLEPWNCWEKESLRITS